MRHIRGDALTGQQPESGDAAFDEKIEDLSAELVNAPVESIAELVQGGLQSIARHFDMQYGALSLISNGFQRIVVNYSYLEPGTEIDHTPKDDIAKSFPWFTRMCTLGIPYVISDVLKDFPPDAESERKYCMQNGIVSAISVPINMSGNVLGSLNFWTKRGRRDWPEVVIRRLSFVGKVFANALSRKCDFEAMQAALEENRRLQEQLAAENLYLRQEIVADSRYRTIIGQSDVLQYVLFRVEQVAPSDATVLLLGETGTGKGLFAHAIHTGSSRKDKPFITVNCAALPTNLIESELFGREKGAFTGAHSRQLGRFEVSDGGTLFLDEIGDLPLELQAKLLRAVQSGEFERIGSSRTIKVDVRIIAATSHDLREEIRQRKFREDLFYRLNVFPITIPPLRQRKEDIPLLVDEFVRRYGKKMGKTFNAIARDDLESLKNYSWPGNVRELEGIIERMVITSPGPVLRLTEGLEQIDHKETGPCDEVYDLETIERQHILKILAKIGWKIEGHGGASELLKIKPSTLRARMLKLKIYCSS